MTALQIQDHIAFLAFWIGFSRWAGLLFQLPLFDQMAIPTTIKVLAAFVIHYAFYPLTEATLKAELLAVGKDHFGLLVMAHTSIGLMMGFMVKSIMGLFTAAGSIITQQIGFSSVTYFDPTQGQQIGPFEKLLQWTVLIAILTSGALIPMFKGVVESFSTFSVSTFYRWQDFDLTVKQLFKEIITLSIMLGAPLLFANILMNLVFGIVSRTIPQMNVLMVSFIVNIGFGLSLFLILSTEFFELSIQLYIDKLALWFAFFKR
jgi:flagellar biosynthetic protein FliR